VQAPLRHAPRDPAVIQAGGEQLRHEHESVLDRGEGGDRGVW
jgi:hypothetical protein